MKALMRLFLLTLSVSSTAFSSSAEVCLDLVNKEFQSLEFVMEGSKPLNDVEYDSSSNTIFKCLDLGSDDLPSSLRVHRFSRYVDQFTKKQSYRLSTYRPCLDFQLMYPFVALTSRYANYYECKKRKASTKGTLTETTWECTGKAYDTMGATWKTDKVISIREEKGSTSKAAEYFSDGSTSRNCSKTSGSASLDQSFQNL